MFTTSTNKINNFILSSTTGNKGIILMVDLNFMLKIDKICAGKFTILVQIWVHPQENFEDMLKRSDKRCRKKYLI